MTEAREDAPERSRALQSDIVLVDREHDASMMLAGRVMFGIDTSGGPDSTVVALVDDGKVIQIGGPEMLEPGYYPGRVTMSDPRDFPLLPKARFERRLPRRPTPQKTKSAALCRLLNK